MNRPQKERWNKCSALARAITTKLKTEDFLKIPFRQKGWGLAAYMPIMVAEHIDIILKEQG